MAQPSPRLQALDVCLNVVKDGRSLSKALPQSLAKLADPRDRALVQQLVFGTLRWQLRLQAIAAQLMDKPLKPKDQDVFQLILIGLYQLIYLDIPEHAAVSETVSLTKALKKPWAKGLVNAVLRSYQRESETVLDTVDANPVAHYSHPQWLWERLKKAYPDHWAQIMDANNRPAPLTLRINPLKTTREQFLKKLEDQGIESEAHPCSVQGINLLRSLDITQLPGFDAGEFSVQDGAAQQAGYLLSPQPEERILDACSAPGGKTTHLLEMSQNQADVVALDIEPERLERVQENLSRLALKATLKAGDAANLSAWWDTQPFDKILLDAPCSATGIIRRQPDIKWHRKPQDIKALVETQKTLLDTLWTTLKPGGLLLYATCSILPQENIDQITDFLSRHPDAKEHPILSDCADMIENNTNGAHGPGLQFLPGLVNMDGFYYCLLQKQPKA